MFEVILWTLVYSFTTAASIVLLGQRDLLSGNILSLSGFLQLLFHWKFILSMTFALAARFSFVLTNKALLGIPRLAPASTTITTFITLFCLIFVVAANVYFLEERLNITQILGGLTVMVGIFLLLK